MTARQVLHALLALGSLATGAAAVAQDQDVIPPEQVFKYTTAADAQKVHLKFAILDDYYLYRSRFGFDTSTPGVTLSAPEFPKGEIHSDEYFGEQEIYRGKFEIAIPYRRSSNASAVALEIRLQGCADRGLCYLPQSWDAVIALPAPDPFSAGAANPLTSATDDLLPVDEAFVMNARFDKPNELTVGWQIAPNYYLYRDKFTFKVDGKVELGRATLPKGKSHRDENFGDVEVFYDYVEAKVPFSRASPDALDVVVTGGFQGCKDASICYPPGEQTMALVLPATSDFPASAASSSTGGDGPVSEQDQWAARIVNGSWLPMLGWFFVAGLALSLTPCVLPMVPILSSIIAGQGGTVSASRGFFLSLAYVLGMATTYTAAGALAALAGRSDSSDVPEALDHQPVRGPVLRAVAQHVRAVRAANADGDPDPALAARGQAEGRQLHRRRDHGRAHRADRDDLRRAAARRSARGDRPDRRRRARRERTVRDEPRHGRAAAARRRLGGTGSAARGTVDEHGQGRLRRADGGRLDLDDGAGAAGLAHARALGSARVPHGRVPRRVRALCRRTRGRSAGSRKGSAFSRASTARYC